MSRLWDKGDPLDQEVLEFTAGEDHKLDNRLVPYDTRASIAHAEMLEASGLLSQTHLQQIREGTTVYEPVDRKPGGHIDLGNAAISHEPMNVDIDLCHQIQIFVMIGRVRVIIGQFEAWTGWVSGFVRN